MHNIFLKSNIVLIIATTSISDLPNQVIELDKSISYCAIVDRLGYRRAYYERQPRQFEVSDNDAERAALQLAMRHFSVLSWALQFGRILYSVNRHEKLIGATIGMSSDYFMIVAFDVNTNNFDEIIMQKILPLIKAGQRYTHTQA